MNVEREQDFTRSLPLEQKRGFDLVLMSAGLLGEKHGMTIKVVGYMGKDGVFKTRVIAFPPNGVSRKSLYADFTHDLNNRGIGSLLPEVKFVGSKLKVIADGSFTEYGRRRLTLTYGRPQKTQEDIQIVKTVEQDDKVDFSSNDGEIEEYIRQQKKRPLVAALKPWQTVAAGIGAAVVIGGIVFGIPDVKKTVAQYLHVAPISAEDPRMITLNPDKTNQKVEGGKIVPGELPAWLAAQIAELSTVTVTPAARVENIHPEPVRATPTPPPIAAPPAPPAPLSIVETAAASSTNTETSKVDNTAPTVVAPSVAQASSEKQPQQIQPKVVAADESPKVQPPANEVPKTVVVTPVQSAPEVSKTPVENPKLLLDQAIQEFFEQKVSITEPGQTVWGRLLVPKIILNPESDEGWRLGKVSQVDFVKGTLIVIADESFRKGKVQQNVHKVRVGDKLKIADFITTPEQRAKMIAALLAWDASQAVGQQTTR